MRALIFLAALPLLAEVTPAQREAYFKAAAHAANLKLEVIQAERELQLTVASMAESCKETKLIVNEKRDPTCSAPEKK